MKRGPAFHTMVGTIILLARLLGVRPALAQGRDNRHEQPAYWGDLTPGPYPIGFMQRWVIDSTRRLPGGDTTGVRYRPILLNLWYPGVERSSAPMRYQDYFDGALRAAQGNGELVRYATALTTYERQVAMEEVLGEGNDTMPVLRQRFERLLASATAVRRDLQIRPGRLPVVVYTSGAQSSYDENAVLCEYLASHGLLVVGSAFPQEDNSDLTTSTTDESRQRDIRRLLLEIGRLPLVEPGSVVAIGHSAGAQALLLFATDPSAPIDAWLLFDTTQDYARLTDRTWSYFTDHVIDMRAKVHTPIVFFAGPQAFFELGDSLSATRRWFVQVPTLSHNEYLSQGILHGEITAGLPGYDSARAARARRTYDALVTYVESWIAWYVAAAKNLPQPSALPLIVTYAAPGERWPTPSGSEVLSARELRHIFSTGSSSDFVNAFMRSREGGAESGSNDVLAMLLTGALADSGQRDRATETYALLLARDSSVRRVVTTIANRARMFDGFRAIGLAERWWGYVSELDPTAEIPLRYRH